MSLYSVSLCARYVSEPARMLICCCCWLSTIVALPAQDVPPAGTVTMLFDGESLDGWDGDLQYWRVEHGAIVGEIPKGTTLNKNTWLVWKNGELTDFDLRLQFRLTGAAAANSGIQFRCQVTNVDHVSGYQADLDLGAVWLGRIYDEHGRALLVERGTRVQISEDGQRQVESFAPARQYAVLFRENAWNDYRIVAVGDHIAVFINGTLFSELQDQQINERDLHGQLAFQLHSGPETRIEFRDIQLQQLHSNDTRLGQFTIRSTHAANDDPGVVPTDDHGQALNLGFESGDLTDWTATGNAFDGQPVEQDGIARRWPGQTGNKQGQYFIGGFEVVQDRGIGTLTSVPFKVTHPYGSFLIGGGQAPSTRLELLQMSDDGTAETVILTATGRNQEQMQRTTVDLRRFKDRRIAIRLIDENAGGWGHLNFDDFRFHDVPPTIVEQSTEWRSTFNPVLQHLLPNPDQRPPNDADLIQAGPDRPGLETISQMHVPPGFSVQVIAAEPELHQPMAFTFDAGGRLWVAEGYCYPQKRPDGEGIDRILIFTDSDGDGHFETRQIFTEGLNLVSGLQVGHGGVWVGAAPQLLFIPDRDGNDLPDSEPQVLLDGFGSADTHETLNNFLWGPDGWLYGNQGVFNTSRIGPPGATDDQRISLSAGVWRYHPTKHVFEVFAEGGSNQWGLDYDDFGQMFMTHCRSFWGRGLTTHVMQGGHYWNQVNSGYAPFVSAESLPGIPAMKNYLLASARYDHGAGGAGKPGTDEVFGGHSHVGTMIYLGDNWPSEYRNHLFTHNLHGHQINHQINLREAGGYNTVHAGRDVLFCADRQYIGVDLQCGPDGAVYISDWYDPRHCHNPDTEQWDRGNGRMYRMRYDATWKPVMVDYTTATDDALAAAQLHANDWHVRMSRLVLSERAVHRKIAESAVLTLQSIAVEHPEPARRLRAVWALHGIGRLQELVPRLLTDNSEYVRAWTIQLAVEFMRPEELADSLIHIARDDVSLLVRRYLASAIQRVPPQVGWTLAEALSTRPDTETDRDLPSLLWFGIAELMSGDLDRAFRLADRTKVQALRDYVIWYAARLSSAGRETVVSRIALAEPDQQTRLLSLLELATRGMRGLPTPPAWPALSTVFYDSSNTRTRRAAESVGAAFGDPELYIRMRRLLADQEQGPAAKQHALSILASDSSLQNLPLFLSQLDTAELGPLVIPLLSRFNDDTVADQLITRLEDLPERDQNAALDVLSSRSAWAHRLLDQIVAGQISATRLTAFYARQMASLGDSSLNERLEKDWGSFGQTSEELKAEIARVAAATKAAPMWAFSADNGAQHFKKLCASCHFPGPLGESLAPRLAGSGAKGIDYLVENVIDPNAVIGRDYQARILVTTEGRVLTGLIEKETDSAITLRTTSNSVIVPRAEIEEMRISPNSFMPEGLLNTLNERERIELFKYLLGQ